MELKGTGSGPWRVALAFGLVAVLLFFLYRLQTIVLLAFLGVVLGILLHTVAALGIRYLKLPRGVSVILAAVVFILVVLGTLALLALPVAQEGTAFVKELPEKIGVLTHKLERFRQDFPLLQQVLPATEAGAQPSKEGLKTMDVAKKAIVTLSTATEWGARVLAIFFFALFLAWDPQRWLQGVAEIGPRSSRQWRMNLYRKIAASMQNYLFTLGIYMLMMGALWTLGLWLIGIDFPLLFGVIGGLVEVVPYVGPLIGLVPPLLVALTLGPIKVVFVMILYGLLHIVEGYVLVPYLLQRQEHLPPPLVVLSILVFGSLFGMLGVILAVPLGMAGFVLARETIYAD